MKLTVVVAVLSALLTASCAHPLEQIVDEHHQQRIEDANRNMSLAQGAADGLGGYIAQDHEMQVKSQH